MTGNFRSGGRSRFYRPLKNRQDPYRINLFGNYKGINLSLHLSKTTFETSYIVLLNLPFYTVENINIFIETKKVVGIIIYQQQEEENHLNNTNSNSSTNHIPDELNLGRQSRWNPKGSNLLKSRMNIPLSFIDHSQQETIQLIRSTAKWNMKNNPKGIESSMVISMNLYSGILEINRETCESFNFKNIK